MRFQFDRDAKRMGAIVLQVQMGEEGFLLKPAGSILRPLAANVIGKVEILRILPFPNGQSPILGGLALSQNLFKILSGQILNLTFQLCYQSKVLLQCQRG